MTINSETRVAGPFEGNDSTVVFPFTFKVFDSDELYVVHAADAIETVLELGADYSVTLNPDQNAAPGGSITLVAPLETDSTLTLTSDLEALQPLDLTNQGGFYPRVINNAFDRVTILIQQLKAVVSRTLKFPLSDGPVSDLPGRAARAGRVLAFDPATAEPVAGPTIYEVETVAATNEAIAIVASNIDDVVTVADNINDVTNFADVYYGPSATNPTTRKDGSPLEEGDLYFNTDSDRLRVYDGATWRETVGGSVSVQNFSGDGVETEFVLDFAPEAETATQVYVAGVYQQKNTYEIGGVDGDVLIFSEAPPVGTDNIEVVVVSVISSDDILRGELASPDDALGASLITGAEKVVNSVAALRLLSKTANSKHASVTGYYAQGDGGGGHYWLDLDDVTSADNGGTIIVAADGGRWKIVAQEAVTSKTFGAKGDKVTNDTVRLQAYLNWCASFTLWKPMAIEGICLVAASLIVNRQVDTTLSEWRVVAANAESGFLQNTAFTLFESSIAMPGVDPVCESITFENIRFEAGAAAGGAYTLTKKFLRIKFLNCYFYKVRLLSSVTYIQSFYFDNCNFRFWPGVWLVASHAFDTHFVQCQSEFGNGYLTNFANGSYNLTFTDGLHEGSVGGLVSGGGFRQLKVDGYYLEGNGAADIAMDAGATNWGVTVSNCIFAATAPNVANVNFYNIVWGPTFGAEGGGNYHTNGRLHDNSGLAAGGLLRGAAGDAAPLAVFKSPINADGASGAFAITNTLGTGTQNYANFTRRDNMVRVEFSYTFVGASGTNACLIGLPKAAMNALISGFVNYTDYTATAIRIVGGTGFLISGAADRFAPCSDNAGAGITYTALNGKTVVAEMEYRVA